MWSVLAIATLVTWLIAGAAGIYMFGTWLSHGGPGHQRARSDGLPPAVIFTHLGFGALGFVAWVSYLATGWDWLAWTGVGLLMPGIGLGICTVTLWAPYPTPPGHGAPVTGDAGPGGAGPASGMLAAPAENAIGAGFTDEALTTALSSEASARKLVNDMLAGLSGPQAPARKSRRHLAPLIPAGHGLAAVATFVLAVLAAISAR
jgi:hypothetical protein